MSRPLLLVLLLTAAALGLAACGDDEAGKGSDGELVVYSGRAQKLVGPLLKRFLKAYRDSAAWMIANPDEAATLAVKRAIDGTDRATNLAVIQLRNAATVYPATSRGGLGTLDLVSLQKAADAYRKLGLVEREIKVSDVVSSDLLPGPRP